MTGGAVRRGGTGGAGSTGVSAASTRRATSSGVPVGLDHDVAMRLGRGHPGEQPPDPQVLLPGQRRSGRCRRRRSRRRRVVRAGARSSSTETSGPQPAGRERGEALQLARRPARPASRSAVTPSCTSGLARNRSATTTAPSRRARAGRPARPGPPAPRPRRARRPGPGQAPGGGDRLGPQLAGTGHDHPVPALAQRADQPPRLLGRLPAVAPSIAISTPDPLRRTPRRRAASRSGSSGSVRRSSICR